MTAPCTATAHDPEALCDELHAARARIVELQTEVSMRYCSVVHDCCERAVTAEAEVADLKTRIISLHARGMR